MNSFEIMATTARKAAAGLSDEMEKAKLKARADIYDYLATLEFSDFYAIFDSGAFNSIVRGYLAAAYDNMEKADNPKAQRTMLFYSLEKQLDELTASQAEEYYKRH